jgi:hypothetical protein
VRRGGPAAAALAVAALLAALPLVAATKKPAPESPRPGASQPLSPAASLEKRVREVKLGNGMRFLLLRRGTAPVFAGILRFKVGSADDPGGETGLAHLFEHMAFKGTTTIGVSDAAKEAPILDALDGVARDLTRSSIAARAPTRRGSTPCARR